MDELDLINLENGDLDAMLAIEEKAYPFPWTRGNFLDSFESGHDIIGLRVRHDDGATSQLVGYLIVMQVLDELHLLNLAVEIAYQGKGLGKRLLNHLIALAKQRACGSILLEVRVSNQRAITVYKVAGFVEIGRRKSYYPAHQQSREDAIVMRCTVISSLQSS
ncbi:MAG: ribosomal protein S18-alanine N-acetyltransferase [Burkholderiaceae bacterium]|nr:ribosomal protein S18-alanine N-acetyltransferase [Burkholderiaceae bacterium]